MAILPVPSPVKLTLIADMTSAQAAELATRPASASPNTAIPVLLMLSPVFVHCYVIGRARSDQHSCRAIPGYARLAAPAKIALAAAATIDGGRSSPISPHLPPPLKARYASIFGASADQRVVVESRSILRTGAAELLQRAAAALGLEAAAFRAERRAGRTTRDVALRGGTQQRDEPIERILPVALLRAELLRLDDQHAILGEPAAGQRLELCPNPFRQQGRA